MSFSPLKKKIDKSESDFRLKMIESVRREYKNILISSNGDFFKKNAKKKKEAETWKKN